MLYVWYTYEIYMKLSKKTKNILRRLLKRNGYYLIASKTSHGSYVYRWESSQSKAFSEAWWKDKGELAWHLCTGEEMARSSQGVKVPGKQAFPQEGLKSSVLRPLWVRYLMHLILDTFPIPLCNTHGFISLCLIVWYLSTDSALFSPYKL